MQKSKTKHKQVKRSKLIAKRKPATEPSPRAIALPPHMAAKLAKADAEAKVSETEKQLCLDATDDIQSSAGHSVTYTNPQDFFEVVRGMKRKGR